ncbi:DNA-3-methyladenine glycosylase I [Schleiferilactobacillus perolens]|jgi:DNA-3-methyladenine glycosylase I|uniref:DNA-3-methyladenine glycosylase I n=1 Tax=Schleiferilactobacillus perolens TaxID=100468 RepID=UPI0023546645|nr:DNA-3-methyladenine glycosylase I [Schleiferilactobacillus perolens]MCI2171533.1 DNA-3-methyladenine glycosylase I [Schleiferilactobacillus perolens]
MAEERNGIDEYHSMFGHPTHDPQKLFEFLVVAVFQPGLSWKAAASKLPVFEQVFAHFDAKVVAGFDEATIEEIESNPDMIRNPRKVRAIVKNAQAIVQLAPEFKDFADYWWSFQGQDGAAVAKDMKKRGFTFVGPTTMQLMLVGTGVAPRPVH